MEQRKEKMEGYPIGQQDFCQLREANCVYVDKTRYIEKILRQKAQYIFLARPRRFGKSLFLSTLRYFFEGRRDLFKGLDIDSYDWKWEEYPVLHLDLNTDKYSDPRALEPVLDKIFRGWEKKYDVDVKDTSFSQRFGTIIETAHLRTGKPVVILVDEYDKPLVSNLNKKDNFEHYREQLASIYSNLKSSAEHIRLAFLTGVSRFSKLSVFSDLNNLREITFDDEYADICGITEKELLSVFQDGISHLAEKRDFTFEEACSKLKRHYDGYRFAREGSDIYNPWSILSCMNTSRIEEYWVFTGIPDLIAKTMRRQNVDLEKILNTRCRFSRLAGFDLSALDPLALLYQTGYITIKKYHPSNDSVTLGVPNIEVNKGLFDVLLPLYVQPRQENPDTVVDDILNAIDDGAPKELMESIDIFLAGIPYEMKMEDENNFHNALYILLRLIGAQVHTEVHTSDGRIDLVIETSQYIYIIELKFNKDSQTAINQIEEKSYDLQFRHDSRKIFRIGVNFNPSTRRLDQPIIR